jgi:hypothetical protein
MVKVRQIWLLKTGLMRFRKYFLDPSQLEADSKNIAP